MGSFSSVMMGVADFPIATLRALKIHPDAAKKKKAECPEETDTTMTPRSSDSGRASTRQSIDTRSVTEPTTAAEAPGTLSPPPAIEDEADMGRISAEISSASVEAEEVSRSLDSSVPVIPQLSHPGSLDGSDQPAARPASAAPSDSQSRSDAAPGSLTPETGRSRSSSHRRSTSGGDRSRSPQPFTLDAAFGTGKGVARIAGSGLKAPMDFTMAVTKGFHNVPRMFGEEVRTPGRVTGIKSGLRTAGKVSYQQMYTT